MEVRLWSFRIFHHAVYSEGHIAEYHYSQWENHNFSSFVENFFESLIRFWGMAFYGLHKCIPGNFEAIEAIENS